MAFGPMMLIWFPTLIVLGLRSIKLHPEVLAALNPTYIVFFFANNGWTGLPILGSVFLVIPKREKVLYVDIRHFSQVSIRLTWFSEDLPVQYQQMSCYLHKKSPHQKEQLPCDYLTRF